MLLAFVGIAIAIALGVVALLRPAAQAAAPAEVAPQYSEQQVADAKKAVCSAYDKTSKAVSTAGTQSSDDPTLKFIISVNTRLATQFSSRYITETLNANPGTPPDLATNVREMASAWDDIVLLQLGGAQGSAPDYAPFYAKLDSSDADIAKACK